MGGHLTPLTRSTHRKCSSDSCSIGCIISTASLLSTHPSIRRGAAVVAQMFALMQLQRRCHFEFWTRKGFGTPLLTLLTTVRLPVFKRVGPPSQDLGPHSRLLGN